MNLLRELKNWSPMPRPKMSADAEVLDAAWRQTALRLQAATDQHAAMTQELEALAASDPKEFSQEQIWVLIRAIKVQSQILEMYLGYSLDV